VILNANIPLNTTSPARQYPWRVGVFLGIFLLNFGLGWTIIKHLFIGIQVPQLTTPSGLALRITPEHALWLNEHTAGLTLSNSCPLDLPTLVAFKKPSWVILGDTGSKEEMFFTGKVPEELKNYEIAFSCKITPTAQGFFLGNATSLLSFTIPLTAPDGWVWMNNKKNPLELKNHGISFATTVPQNDIKIPVPQKNLTSALPIANLAPHILSQQWEGLNKLLTTNTGIALFSWDEKESVAFGLAITGELSNEEAVALTYDFASIPTTSQKILRKDDISYNITTREELSVVSISNTQKEIQLQNGTPVAFITLQNNVSLFSTAQTTWEQSAPQWKAKLFSEKEFERHTPHTLASFGRKIFTTKNKIDILDE
jgi:hypothetical protein